MGIQNDIQELIDQGVITLDTAQDLRAYYQAKHNAKPSRLILIFSVLGALLVGLGIILILAHNWDELSRFTKTIFAFIPLLIGQSLAAYTLIKKKEERAWKEGSAVFLILSIGASIALIGQIYHLPGNMSGFLLTWSILALPVVYLLDSSIGSILFIIGITSFLINTFSPRVKSPSPFWYWLLMFGLMPFYYHIIKERFSSLSTYFHHWLIPISLIIGWSAFAREESAYPAIGYMSLFSIFYMIGNFEKLKSLRLSFNGYRVIGAVAIIITLLACSFEPFWEWISSENWPELKIYSKEIINLLAFGIAYILLVKLWKEGTLNIYTPLVVIFIIYFILIIIGHYYPNISRLGINFLLLTISIITIRKGILEDHLGILNFGLLIITALLICRFFDTNISFVVRGILFILVGISFFIANSILLKRRRS